MTTLGLHCTENMILGTASDSELCCKYNAGTVPHPPPHGPVPTLSSTLLLSCPPPSTPLPPPPPPPARPRARPPCPPQEVEVCLSEPSMFWSAGEDGVVRQYDTRSPDQKAYGSANVLVNLMTAGKLP
jgi:hypothetical protein